MNIVSGMITVLALIIVSQAALPTAASAQSQCPPREKIVFTNTYPATAEDPARLFRTAEIHLMNPDGSEPRQLTYDEFADSLPSLSPDGKKIVFDSNRTAVESGQPITSTRSHLFVINVDESSETAGIVPTPLNLIGSSATWSPDARRIAFHASRSGGFGIRILGRPEPGGPARDSDIFVVNLDDRIAHGEPPTNITATLDGASEDDVTTTPDVVSEDDADWSPDGHKIAFTARPSDCATAAACAAAAEIWKMNADGTGRQQLTFNTLDERSPDWSPDGSKIAFMCRLAPGAPFEICVMNADGSGREVLTQNAVADLGPSWSPDGTRIAFQRIIIANEPQIWVMNYAADQNDSRNETQLTFPDTVSFFPNWRTAALGCSQP